VSEVSRRKKEPEVPLVVPIVEGNPEDLKPEDAKPAEKPVEKNPRKKREKKVEESKEEKVVMVETMAAPAVIPEAFLREIRQKALDWARECGLKGEIDAAVPIKIDYPRYGYGFSVNVREKDGKERMATARFTSAGVRSYWSLDGKVVF
jgi:hypothetical protein